MALHVRGASEGDVPQAADVLARAFATDPPFIAALGHPAHPLPLLRALYTSLLTRHYLPHGAVDVAVAGEEVLAAAVWGAPGPHGPSPIAKARIAVDLLPVFRTRAVRLLRQDRLITAHQPPGRHWYLFAIGAAAPGRGSGGLLLDHGIARAVDDGAYLEASTPDSARLYERKGFDRIGTIPTPGGTLVRMWRDAAPVQRRKGASR